MALSMGQVLALGGSKYALPKVALRTQGPPELEVRLLILFSVRPAGFLPSLDL